MTVVAHRIKKLAEVPIGPRGKTSEGLRFSMDCQRE